MLLAPDPVVRASYLEALGEYRAEGMLGDPEPGLLAHPPLFERYVAEILAGGDALRPRSADRVPYTMRWWTDGTTYLGRLSIRHRLTASLEAVGGHVSYDVRPSRRREGHATAMLAAALPVAAGLGLEALLITCEETNVASRRVIEHNGGVAVEPAGTELRYWVPTGGPSS